MDLTVQCSWTRRRKLKLALLKKKKKSSMD